MQSLQLRHTPSSNLDGYQLNQLGMLMKERTSYVKNIILQTAQQESQNHDLVPSTSGEDDEEDYYGFNKKAIRLMHLACQQPK